MGDVLDSDMLYALDTAPPNPGLFAFGASEARAGSDGGVASFCEQGVPLQSQFEVWADRTGKAQSNAACFPVPTLTCGPQPGEPRGTASVSLVEGEVTIIHVTLSVPPP